MFTLQEKLALLRVRKFKIDNGKIYVFQDVDFSGHDLDMIPEIYSIEGDLKMTGCKLKDFSCVPKIISGLADFSFNYIETLESCPNVGGLKISDNSLVSLKGCQRQMKIFSISRNHHLYSLRFAPIAEIISCDDIDVSEEEIDIYKSCNTSNCWDPKYTILKNLENLARKEIKLVIQKKWKLFEQLDEKLRGTILQSKLGI